MDGKFRHKGSVLLIVIFVIALLAAVVMGMLQLSTEEIKLVHNQISAAHAMAIAEAGLNDAFSELRTDPNWSAGFIDKAFNGGSYMVDAITGTLPNLTITSTGTSSQGFVAKVRADITVGSSSPYILRIDNLRINE
jgi:Tfp pilus assembly protein PilX